MEKSAQVTYATIILAIISCANLVLSLETFAPGHSVVLEKDKYFLRWTYDEDEITFEVKVKTLGWIGFGLSPNGGMTGSDVIIGWVRNGQGNLKDRYATAQSTPSIDKSQDWILLDAKENESLTTIVFKRKLITCDKEDLDISESTARVIWSYGSSDPDDESSFQAGHEARGVKSILLLSYGGQKDVVPPLPNDAFSLDIHQSNVTIPRGKHTLYQCMGFQLPQYQSKHHVIKLEPIVQEGHAALVHHIVMFACYNDANYTRYHGHSIDCTSPNMPDEMNCTTYLYAWAIGGGPFYYPNHVGFPFGNEAAPVFLVMQTHYDNPGDLFAGVTDSSGVRLTLTKTLRKYDSGIVVTGLDFRDGHIIPPGVESFKNVGHCNHQCLSAAMENQPTGINVFAVLLHGHLLARKLKLRHVRDGKELEPLAQDDNYDFNYQEYHVPKTETVILPGDDLYTECTADSRARNYITLGGLATTEEMCLSFIAYYPKIDLSWCLSENSPLELAKVTGNNITLVKGSTKIATPAKYAEMELMDIFNNSIDWTAKENVVELTRLSRTTPKRIMCMKDRYAYNSVDSKKYSIPKIAEPIKRTNNCVQNMVPSVESGGGKKDPKAMLFLVFMVVEMCAMYW